jgi:hypothetical protein
MLACEDRKLTNDIYRQKRLDAAYYISRVLIPPLERIFNLVGADIRAWYDDMPKALRADASNSNELSPKKVHTERMWANRLNIEEHFHDALCILCGDKAVAGASVRSSKLTLVFMVRQVYVVAVDLGECESLLSQN